MIKYKFLNEWMNYCELTNVTTVNKRHLCQKASLLAFTPPGDEVSEVVSYCSQSEQLVQVQWVSNLSKVATQWLDVDSNPWPSSCKAQNIPLHHRIPLWTWCGHITCVIQCKLAVSRQSVQSLTCVSGHFLWWSSNSWTVACCTDCLLVMTDTSIAS